MENRVNTIYIPSVIAENNINTYINKLNFFFKIKGELKPRYEVIFDNVDEVDLLGVLLTYKFLEYSVKNDCFYRPYLSDNSVELKSKIKFYGFQKLISELISGEDAIKEYEKLKIEINNDFFIAPIALIRNEDFSKESINAKYLPHIQNYYRDGRVTNMIFQIFSEVISNFWSHAVDDTLSIIVVHGNSDKIEIACADTGRGIVETLRPLYKNKSDEFILKKSTEKRITSKPNTNHMGYGLWFVNEVVSKAKGKLEFFSSNAYYRNLGGNIKSTKSCFWQGTIINIELPLNNPITIEDIEKDSINNIKINFK